MDQPDRDLERFVHGELAALMRPRAPRSLLPRVMAAARPWYAREWMTWPRHWQAASVVAFVSLVAGLVALPSALPDLGTFAAFGRIFWRLLLEPVVVYMFALGVSVCLMLAVTWALLTRVTMGGLSR
jgi:hypothetical protein